MWSWTSQLSSSSQNLTTSFLSSSVARLSLEKLLMQTSSRIKKETLKTCSLIRSKRYSKCRWLQLKWQISISKSTSFKRWKNHRILRLLLSFHSLRNLLWLTRRDTILMQSQIWSTSTIVEDHRVATRLAASSTRSWKLCIAQVGSISSRFAAFSSPSGSHTCWKNKSQVACLKHTTGGPLFSIDQITIFY